MNKSTADNNSTGYTKYIVGEQQIAGMLESYKRVFDEVALSNTDRKKTDLIRR